MDVTFRIPQSFRDLETTTEDGVYVVETTYTIDEMPSLLDSADEDFERDQSESVIPNFDILFHVLKYYSNVTQHLRDQLWTLSKKMFMAVKADLFDFLDRFSHQQRNQERLKMLNKLKMSSYIFFTACELNEDKNLAFANRPEGYEPAKKVRGKKKATLVSSAVYNRSKGGVLDLITRILSADINQLFSLSSDADVFVNFLMKYVYTLIENTPDFKKEELIFQALCEVFVVALQRYRHTDRFCQKMIELLQGSQDLSASLAALAISNIRAGVLDCQAVVSQLSNIEINDLSKDSSAPKALSAFFLEIGNACSEQMLNNLYDLKKLLDQSSHMIRNAVFEVIYNIIVTMFSNPQNARDEQIRDNLMDILEDYILDQNGYCRSKVIKFWCQLAEKNVIGRERYSTITPKIAGRLEDKSNFVRTSALVFITKVSKVLIPCRKLKMISEKYREMYNQYSESVIAQRLKAKKILQEIGQIEKKQMLAGLGQEVDDDDEENGDNENAQEMEEPEVADMKEIDVKTLVAKWMKFRTQFCLFMEDNEEDFDLIDPEDLEYNSPEVAFNDFRRLLIRKEFKDAMNLLNALKTRYPNAKEFSEFKKNRDDVFLTGIMGVEIGKDNKEILFARQIFLYPLIEIGNQTQNNKSVGLIREADQEKLEQLTAELQQDFQSLEQRDNFMSSFEKILDSFEQYEEFNQIILDVMPKINDMLYSKIGHDVLEAIEFFVMAYEMNLENAEKGIQKMLLLINTKDKAVKDRLLDAFYKIYMNEKTTYVFEVDENQENYEPSHRLPNRDNVNVCFREVKNLFAMLRHLNQGEMFCAEELISEMFKREMFTPDHIRILWAIFHGPVKSNREDKYWALRVLGMIALCKPDIVIDNVHNLAVHSYSKLIRDEDGRDMLDFYLATITSTILAKIYPIPTIESGSEFIKYPNDHQLFKTILRLLVVAFKTMPTDPAFDDVDRCFNNLIIKSIEVFYLYATHPLHLVRDFVSEIDCFMRSYTSHDNDSGHRFNTASSGHATPQSDTDCVPMSQESAPMSGMTAVSTASRKNKVCVDYRVLTRFLYVIAAVSKGYILHMDFCLLRENQIRKRSKDMAKQKALEEKKRKKKLKDSAKKGRKSVSKLDGKKMVNDFSSSDDEEANAEFGGTMGNDRTVLDFIESQIFDKELFFTNGILSRYLYFVKGIAYDIRGIKFPLACRMAAWNALTSFMVLSKEMTIQHRDLVSECLTHCSDDAIRCNLIVSWGDILMRFPNQIEYLNLKLFKYLNEESVVLKATALKTLSMIIQADMLKPTGEITMMAKLIVDEDVEIQNLTRLFFVQMANKDNQNIYNYLTDVISTHAGTNGMPENEFQEMIRFLFELLEKNKSTESLVKKLAERFLMSKDQRLWRDLSYSLFLINYQEKGLTALLNKWQYFRTTLTNRYVYENFQNLIQKLQTQFKDSKDSGGVKMREAITELESRIKAVRASGIENQISERERKELIDKANAENEDEENVSPQENERSLDVSVDE